MHETLAILFDFDDTLGPDSTSGLLQQLGVDVRSFWQHDVQALVDADWDPVPAYLHGLVHLSRSGKVAPITADVLSAWGARLPLYAGVESLFDRLRQQAAEANPRARLEFYLISSGIGEILRALPIARHFGDIWANEFSYDTSGQIDFPRKVVSFTDKTRYVFQVQKGLVGPSSRGRPFEVNRKVESSRLRVPMDRMIVVGDGFTDVPVFSLVKRAGGIAVGVYDRAHRERWGRAWGFIEDGRVSNLVPADYSDGSALSDFLAMAVENLARKIALDERSYQG
ncbi:MAG: haloacid dehalogenase-like hydrolase [Limisphaerales bacterium]|jgi:hypothetical protein